MTAERWEKVKELVARARECGETERRELLEQIDDAALRREVEALIASATRFDPGDVVKERYTIESLIGRGGMGEVYLANDERINRKVALKVLNADLLTSKDGLRRFATEAQAVSALNHPHILTIYEFDETSEGAMFFVAEYVDGTPLDQLIGPDLSLERALDIAGQVAGALAAAHEAGIIHRDIKPENIMIRRDGYAKVLDFGLAKLSEKRPSRTSAGSEDPTAALQNTKPGAVMGTAAYMSPEQARGLTVDARTDIWSLGVVLYEMITGRRPFAGDTQADLLVSVLSTEPPPLSSGGRQIPAELEWAVTKALSKDVEARYQTAKGLRADLERVRRQTEVDRSLARSSPQGVGETRRVTDDVAALTEKGDPRNTQGGASDTARAASFWSAPSVSGFVHEAGSHKLGWSAAVLALVAIVAAGAYLLLSTRAGAEIDSVAVLPLENLGGNPDLVYAADGLSEALIDRLSLIPRLKVISRSSSFKFRGGQVDLREVARQLGVRAVVTGTVAQVGDELAIRIEIVDAVEDRHLAGGQYRPKLADLINTQRDIAQRAVEQFRVRLTDAQSERLRAPNTDNSEAFRYYLNGLVARDGTTAGHEKALVHFEKATELDPGFAAAWAEIGWTYWYMANTVDDPSQMMPKARAAADRAIAIDGELAKAHLVKAAVYEHEFDWSGAEASYKRAIELSPNLDAARNSYAFFLSIMDRQEEALAQLAEQRERDPLNVRLLLLQKGIILVQARRFDEALAAYHETQAADPSKPVPDFALGYAYGGKGQYREAVESYRRSLAVTGGEEKYSQPLVYLTAAYAAMPDKRAEARARLARIEGMSGYRSPALMSIIYAALGDNDKAIALLEEAYIKHDLLLRYVGTGYEYDNLRNDARFADLIKRIGLTPRRSG